jgi:hypothetical protein
MANDATVWFPAPEKSLCHQHLELYKFSCKVMIFFFCSLVHLWSQTWTKSGSQFGNLDFDNAKNLAWFSCAIFGHNPSWSNAES